jgi:16S rRNA (cytosine967-C5)-methyltransferase
MLASIWFVIMTMIQREQFNGLQPQLFDTLRKIVWENTFATKAIQHALKERQDWEDPKRALFSETVYDLIRWWRTLWYLLNMEPSSSDENLQKLLSIYLFSKKGSITELQKKQGVVIPDVLQRIKTIQSSRALRESIPDWLDAQGEKELGVRWETLLTSLNNTPPLTIRVNTLKTTVKHLSQLLQKQGVRVEAFQSMENSSETLLIKEKTNVFKLACFHAGLFEVQDAASQLVSRVLNPQPGMRVIDACAGEGSKTLHLAALMKNKGKIIALDTQEWRLQKLQNRAKKAGANIIETRVIHSSKVYKRLRNTADRVLLDAPCSGLGTLRRNPDIKWKLTLMDLNRIKLLQHDLLQRYSPLLKPQGIMAYSVCSILPSEGEGQIERFLKDNLDFHVIKQKRTWPDTDITDGFYIALLQRISVE